MRLIGIIAILAPIFSFAVACGSSEADPGDEGPGGDDQPATEQEIADCKQSCDKLKFFDCNDSLDQAACYQDCSGATADQIELFVACVTNDTCDPTCSTHIEPPPDDPTGASGDSSASCSSDGCGSGDPPGDGCVEACDSLQFFDCIDASTFTTCTGLCTSADATKKETFVSCVGSASVAECQAVDCYYQFDETAEPGPTPQQLAACKQSCEDMAFFDCISGADAASCAAACDTLSKAEIEAFLICTSSPTDCTSNVECF